MGNHLQRQMRLNSWVSGVISDNFGMSPTAVRMQDLSLFNTANTLCGSNRDRLDRAWVSILKLDNWAEYSPTLRVELHKSAF